MIPLDTTNNERLSFELGQRCKSPIRIIVNGKLRTHFKIFDVRNDGRIYYTVFWAATLGFYDGWVLEKRLAAAFDQLDNDMILGI